MHFTNVPMYNKWISKLNQGELVNKHQQTTEVHRPKNKRSTTETQMFFTLKHFCYHVFLPQTIPKLPLNGHGGTNHRLISSLKVGKNQLKLGADYEPGIMYHKRAQ